MDLGSVLISEPFDLVLLEGEKVAIQIGKPRTLPGLTGRVRDQRQGRGNSELTAYWSIACGSSLKFKGRRLQATSGKLDK